MPRKYYPMAQVCADVAIALAPGGDYSNTTIRCAINDHLDGLSKDGHTVNHNYDQPWAIRQVNLYLSRLLAHHEKMRDWEDKAKQYPV